MLIKMTIASVKVWPMDSPMTGSNILDHVLMPVQVSDWEETDLEGAVFMPRVPRTLQLYV